MFKGYIAKPVILPIKGENTAMPAKYIDDRATPDCQNMLIKRAILQQRCGYTPKGSATTGDIMKIIEHQRQGSSYLVRISTTKVNYWDSGNNDWSDITGASDLTGQNTIPVDATIAKLDGANILVFTNFQDNIKKWTEPGNNIADLGGSPPKAKYCLWFKAFLVIGYLNDGGTIYENTVKWSDINNPELWIVEASTQAGCVNLAGKDPITGLKRLQDFIIVCRERSVWRGAFVGGTAVLQFKKACDIGFLVGATVCQLPKNVLIGLTQFGLGIFDGMSMQLVAPEIADDLKENINSSYLSKAFAKVVPDLNEYWLFVPTGTDTYPNTVYKFNYETLQVYKDKYSGITAIGQQSEIGSPILFGDKDGKVYERDTDKKDDDTTAISSYWTSKDIYLREGYYHYWVGMIIEAKGDKVDISVSTDEGASWSSIKSLSLTSDWKTYVVYFESFTELIRIKLSNSDSNSSFEVRKLVLYGMVKESIIL